MTDQTTPAAKPMIRRVTSMAAAMLLAAQQAGIDTSNVRLRDKPEPAWTVTRREPREKRRGRR